MVRETDPEFAEAGYPGWKAVAFRHPVAGYVCGAFLFDDRVRFLFEHGIQLDDPAAILEGATKQTRHVDLRPGQPLPLDALRTLIREAVALGEARRTTSRRTGKRG